ncbi:MAG: N-acetylmuramoyl-L-alanine amidase [Lentimicrobium sp.]|nr:N-acetylmuramoyl-L-alanine amidase [Lentimicrobium sp.]
MGLKRVFLFFILPVSGLFLQMQDLNAQKVQRVVIDAGHGGHDPGAVGLTSKEKDITLKLALKTGKLIQDNLKDVEVIYTRKTDVFVELFRRAKIANEAKADLFISIHCNANKSTSPYGAETYVMGLHRSDANLAVAQLENAAILLEDDYHVQYDGFDPRSPEGYIFFSMLQNAFMDQSLQLASGVQKHFKDIVNLHNRGVKQAGFLVLYKTTMPSILIEAGFISNAKEEKLLNSEYGQNNIAKSIYKAVREYKSYVESNGKPYKIAEVVPESESVKVKEKEKEIDTTPPVKIENIAKEVPAVEPSKPVTSVNLELVFKVQFMISDIPLTLSGEQNEGIPSPSFYIHQGVFKYTAGNENSFDDAQCVKADMVNRGYKDAFVVAFLNGERIDINKAREMALPK